MYVFVFMCMWIYMLYFCVHGISGNRKQGTKNIYKEDWLDWTWKLGDGDLLFCVYSLEHFSFYNCELLGQTINSKIWGEKFKKKTLE